MIRVMVITMTIIMTMMMIMMMIALRIKSVTIKIGSFRNCKNPRNLR